MKFYLDRDAVKKSNKIFLWGIDLNEKDIKEDYVMYEGDTLPDPPIVLDRGTVRTATKKEQYDLGIFQLSEGQYFEGEKFICIKKPSYRHEWKDNKWTVDLELLEEGECIVDGEVIKKDKPGKLYFWDKEKSEYIYCPEKYTLQVGEKIVDGEIIKVPIPDGMDFPYWNRETLEYEDNTPVNELLKKTKDELIEIEIKIIASEKLNLGHEDLIDKKNILLKTLENLKSKIEKISVVVKND